MIWNEVLCIGDSLTYGARDKYGRSYPAALGKILSEITGEFYICHNYGINGETSSDLLRRTWNILKSNSNVKLCLLMIGTNDTKIPIKEDIYEDNIRQIVSSIHAHGMTAIVGTLPTLEFSPNYIANREYIGIYNEIIEKLSNEIGFYKCEMDNLGEYLIDGVHFTHEGYIKVAEKWAEKINQLR